MNIILPIIGGCILDLIFGDPQWRWHPVRLVGRVIEKLERKLNADKINKIFAGVILVILVIGLTVFCVWGILELGKFVHPIFCFILSTLLIYFVLSVKALAVEANKVKIELQHKDIQKAREDLSMIVGRDTDRLDEPEIIRATVETVAESTMDGVVGPLFYAFLGGPILAWAYKAINTLDSMVGYRSERFIEFGKASAILDGLVNYIPAKITCFLISISSLCFKKDCFSSIKWGLKYFLKGPANNSIATEAAMAGALGVQLGGLNFYGGKPILKPRIGSNKNKLSLRTIEDAIKIAYIVALLMIITGASFSCSSNLHAKELRVISVAPSTTEIACALGLTDNLVGVSTWCDYPSQVKTKEKVGSFSEPNIEKILFLKPDLVLATGLEQARVVEGLKSFGIKVVTVDPKNFEELFDSFKEIGKITGRKLEAQALIKNMKDSIAKVSEKVKSQNLSKKPKVYIEVWHDPIIVAGKGSFIDEMIMLAGAVNIAYDTDRPFSQFSPELIVERDPDVIILGYMNVGISARDAIAKRLGWQNIKAVKNSRVYDDIDSDLLFRPGPRLALGLEELYKRFYE